MSMNEKFKQVEHQLKATLYTDTQRQKAMFILLEFWAGLVEQDIKPETEFEANIINLSKVLIERLRNSSVLARYKKDSTITGLADIMRVYLIKTAVPLLTYLSMCSVLSTRDGIDKKIKHVFKDLTADIQLMYEFLNWNDHYYAKTSFEMYRVSKALNLDGKLNGNDDDVETACYNKAVRRFSSESAVARYAIKRKKYLESLKGKSYVQRKNRISK